MAEIKIEDIKPNSHAYKASQAAQKEKPKVKPVIDKSARVPQKDSFGKKFAKSFLAEEVNDVKEYIIMDCIVPGIKNAVLNMLSMTFFGESYDGRSRYRGKDDRRDYSSYYGKSYYSGGSSRREERRDRRESRSDKIDYRNIVLYRREDAERVVSDMRARIRETGGVSIAELFSLIDEPSDYTDTSYGWLDERDVGIRRISSGFLIDVAEARYLD